MLHGARLQQPRSSISCSISNIYFKSFILQQRCNTLGDAINPYVDQFAPWLSLLLLETMAGEFNGVRVHADVYAAQLGFVQITACALSLKEVITGMEMKGDLKECTAVGS